MSDSKTLAELSEESGIPARTIRFYIARGLLEGPVKAGRGAMYTPQHLERLEKIKNLQAEGRMLSEIVHLVNQDEPLDAGPPPVAWWQHVVHDDVMVWVRGDVSPWRMRQIRAAIDDLSGRLSDNQSTGPTGPSSHNDRSNRK
jgi:DNA-binding transcriptional MerR regulator